MALELAVSAVVATAVVINPLGNRTSMAYDLDGRRILVRDAEEHVTTTVYDLADRVLATVDALGHQVTNIYNAMAGQHL